MATRSGRQTKVKTGTRSIKQKPKAEVKDKPDGRLKKLTPDEERSKSLAKSEFIADVHISLRSLSRKYNLSYTRLYKWAVDEDWVQQRQDFIGQTNVAIALGVQEITKDSCKKAFKCASNLLDKIEESIKLLDAEDRKGIKDLTSALKDMKEIGLFRAEMDKLEQLARIRKLEKDGSEEAKETTITIAFKGEEIEDYAD